MSKSHGAGLARGPAALVGGLLLAFGLAALIRHNQFPPVTNAFPSGHPSGSEFLGFEVNGWTGWFTAVTGSLVLFGSSQHALAKLASLAGGLALAGGSLLGAVNDSILGLAATNTLTDIGLAATAAVLLLNLFVPRGRHNLAMDTMTVAMPMVEQSTDTTAPVTSTTVTIPHAPIVRGIAEESETLPR